MPWRVDIVGRLSTQPTQPLSLSLPEGLSVSQHPGRPDQPTLPSHCPSTPPSRELVPVSRRGMVITPFCCISPKLKKERKEKKKTQYPFTINLRMTGLLVIKLWRCVILY